MTVEFKFQVKDSVWIIYEGKAVQAEIAKVAYESWKSDEKNITYTFFVNGSGSCAILKEEYVFATKEELIKSLD